MIKLNRILFIIIPIFIACSVKSDTNVSTENNELKKKLNKGITLFESKKYTRSLDEFNSIILNDRGSELGVEARFYQAESNFELEQYNEAISSYEKFMHYSSDLVKIEYVKFKICKSYFNLASTYSRDQVNNEFAFTKLQYFIDEFPNSNFIDETEEMLHILRERKAQKVYETGRLYLKLKEYDSAIIYFNDVVENYYDTKFSDQARVSIIFFYMLQGKSDEANSYYEINKDKFMDASVRTEAEEILFHYNDASFWIKNKIRLYK